MDPQLSGFALGLLFAAAKVGAIGTIMFAIAWWQTRRKLQRFEQALPDPGRLDERLASLEQTTDYIGAKVSELATLRLCCSALNPSLDRSALPKPMPEEVSDPHTPRTPH